MGPRGPEGPEKLRDSSWPELLLKTGASGESYHADGVLSAIIMCHFLYITKQVECRAKEISLRSDF